MAVPPPSPSLSARQVASGTDAPSHEGEEVGATASGRSVTAVATGAEARVTLGAATSTEDVRPIGGAEGDGDSAEGKLALLSIQTDADEPAEDPLGCFLWQYPSYGNLWKRGEIEFTGGYASPPESSTQVPIFNLPGHPKVKFAEGCGGYVENAAQDLSMGGKNPLALPHPCKSGKGLWGSYNDAVYGRDTKNGSMRHGNPLWAEACDVWISSPGTPEGEPRVSQKQQLRKDLTAKEEELQQERDKLLKLEKSNPTNPKKQTKKQRDVGVCQQLIVVLAQEVSDLKAKLTALE